ncbi:hypothetical protein Dsin_007604 [Dipteronia sinensis]|uniref:MADS-box domain-containing protein n=1 Tax=Dipteronia sinensis TaxID=43782 RepID=A0AAE0B1R1_9ROSI|nr:hypothetical protein Dsin_007604 [Dipteronia sinensis]
MGQGRQNLKFIENEKARMTTYQRRKRVIKKKAEEFTTLCGVPACMVIYGPKLKNRPVEVDVWPNETSDFMEAVNLYRDKSCSRVVKAYNLFDFFDGRKRKIDDKIKKLRKLNLESKFPSCWDDRLNSFHVNQLRVLLAKFDNKIEAAKRKIVSIKGDDDCQNSEILGGNSNSSHEVLINQDQQIEVDVELRLSIINTQQPNILSSEKPPLDHHPMQFFQSHHRLPFDLNLNYNNQMTIDGGDQNQVVVQPTFYFDPPPPPPPPPTTVRVDNHAMINNQRAMYFNGTSMQQPLPSNISSQLHGSHHDHHPHHRQFNDSLWRHE